MAKFVKQTSDIAVALNRLQGFADNLISSETNRRIQLGREKEARMTEAYQYMLNNENKEITDLELALDSITQNLADRGVKELLVIAQDTTSYGWDLNPKSSLHELIDVLDKKISFQRKISNFFRSKILISTFSFSYKFQ